MNAVQAEKFETSGMVLAANDNVSIADALREYKRTTSGGTGSLTRLNGDIALVGAVVDGEIGNATVVDGAVSFKPTTQPIILNDGAFVWLSESDVARVFAEKYTDYMRFDHHAGAWFVWVGTHWEKNETNVGIHLAGELAHVLSEGREGKTLVATRKRAFAAGAEAFARADPILAVTSATWDRDAYLLATPGGVVDLRTGETRPADPSDMITKITPIAPSDEEDCPRWIQFLDEATGGDTDLVGFLKRWVGYCLTGDTKEHALVFVYGPGGNGKSIFVETVSDTIGSGYATNSPMDTFTAAQGERHSTELARLAGARLVTASETEEGKAWAEAKIKALTGGDKVTARFMRQDFFEFIPQFKLLIIGNYLPTLRNVTEATRRRFNVVPFTVQPARRDVNLKAKLAAEAPGVLRWAINGCLEWQRHGLGQPPVVAEATDTYFSDQDLFAQWLESYCRVDKQNRALISSSTELYRSWSSYMQAAGERPDTAKSFGMKLVREGFQQMRTAQLRGFRGIELKKPVADDAEQ